jgi:hypothetical protein
MEGYRWRLGGGLELTAKSGLESFPPLRHRFTPKGVIPGGGGWWRISSFPPARLAVPAVAEERRRNLMTDEFICTSCGAEVRRPNRPHGDDSKCLNCWSRKSWNQPSKAKIDESTSTNERAMIPESTTKGERAKYEKSTMEDERGH